MAELSVQTTIGSPIEWYKLEVLRDVVNLKESWEHYYKLEGMNARNDLGVIVARTRSLFTSLVAYLGRKWDKDKRFVLLKKELFSSIPLSEDRLREIFFDIQIQLDSDNITKLDTRRSYDGTRVELENKNFGL
jgi:hypothetical protein